MKKVKILVVDDLKENHLVMESVLDDEDLDIIKALSGEEALELCMKHDFSVIFMDVQMPGMDGFETAELLRGIEKTKNIPIIFVTALSKEKASIFKGYEVGAVDYLSKPIDPLILRSKARIFKEMYEQKRIIQEQTLALELKVEELTKLIEEKVELETIALEDSLTKVLNRRGIEKLTVMHWKNCLRYELPLSVLMFDIDFFKRYNDHYGHVQGDKVLSAISQCVKDALFRAEDFVGRYGGEEFLICMPNTNLEGALKVAERVKEAIDLLAIPHEHGGPSKTVSVSIGLCNTFPTVEHTLEELIELADQAMYLAKNNGRNQIRHSIMM